MAHYQYVVLTNAVAGREDEYNEWYSKTHIREVCQIPGFKAATRYKIVPRDGTKAPLKHEYMALYEIDTQDVNATLAELGRRSGAGELVKCSALDGDTTSTTLYERIADYEAK